MAAFKVPSGCDSPQGRERIRCFVRGGAPLADGELCRCPKHDAVAVDGYCSGCLELGSRAGKGVRLRLERILGGRLDASVRVQMELSLEVHGFLQRSGVTRMVKPAPRVLAPMLARNSVIPQAIRACRELCELIERARFAQLDYERAIEELGYCGVPSEEKLERLVVEADAAAAFLSAWDHIAFDASHEHELETCAQRIVSNARDMRTLLQSTRFRPLEAVIATAHSRNAAIDALRPRIRTSRTPPMERLTP